MEQLAKIVEQGPQAVIAFAFLAVLGWMLTYFAKAIDKLGQRIETAVDVNSAILLGMQSQLLTHDLTVSGLNPAAGSTVTERDSRAFAKYVEIQRNLQGVRDELTRRRGMNAASNGGA